MLPRKSLTDAHPLIKMQIGVGTFVNSPPPVIHFSIQRHENMNKPGGAASVEVVSEEARLRDILQRRIMVLDGAYGTLVQSQGLSEAEYRGERFADHPVDIKGCHDTISITQPQVLEGIHQRYLDAGADIITTNSFTATTVSLSDYQLEDASYDINYHAAAVARRVRRRTNGQDAG